MIKAWVAELVDARDLKSLGGFLRAGSTPAPGTSNFNRLAQGFSPINAYTININLPQPLFSHQMLFVSRLRRSFYITDQVSIFHFATILPSGNISPHIR